MSDQEPIHTTTRTEVDRSTSLPGTTRLNALTDGVIAIAITLLVLSFKVPEPEPGVPFIEQLVRLLPLAEMYVASFLLIGYFWVIHHTLFHRIDRHDTALLWLNLLWLFPLTAQPFTSELVGNYPGESVATIVYLGTLSFASLLQVLLWRHARTRGLTADLSAEESRRLWFIASAPLVIFTLGLLLVWIDARIAQRVYLLVFLVPVVRHRFMPSTAGG
jgi:uncharacterized membrane protein